MADAQTQEQATRWGVSVEECQEYLAHLQGAGRHFATAVAFPYENVPLGVFQGVILAVSTAESTCLEKQHKENDEAGVVFQHSSWTKYEVWVYRNMNLLNFSGIHSEEHQGTCMGSLDVFLDTHYGTQWRQKYLLTSGGQSYRHAIDLICIYISKKQYTIHNIQYNVQHKMYNICNISHITYTI